MDMQDLLEKCIGDDAVENSHAADSGCDFEHTT